MYIEKNNKYSIINKIINLIRRKKYSDIQYVDENNSYYSNEKEQYIIVIKLTKKKSINVLITKHMFHKYNNYYLKIFYKNKIGKEIDITSIYYQEFSEIYKIFTLCKYTSHLANNEYNTLAFFYDLSFDLENLDYKYDGKVFNILLDKKDKNKTELRCNKTNFFIINKYNDKIEFLNNGRSDLYYEQLLYKHNKIKNQST